ncbi:hypothetical protein, partial [Deinococcus sp. 23YEL01]|uniref:hypothetical protein n=1 Tax=Deinococcus sp. 23YEL01 TaxID=2745871 RepID=UPI001E2A7CFA
RDALQDATEHSPIWIFIGQNSILRASIACIPYHTTSDAARLFILRPADARIRAVQAEKGLSRPKISSRTQQGK